MYQKGYAKLLSSKVTDKYQTTILGEVRNFLHLKKGDRVTFRIGYEKVVLKKTPYSNYQYLDSLSNSLFKWLLNEDNEAYDHL